MNCIVGSKEIKMDTYFLILISLILMTLWNEFEVHAQSEQSLNLLDFGAIGDGNIDDSQALTKAWEAVCVANSPKNTLLVPEGKTFLVKPLKLQGPCNSSNINFVILSKIIGPKSLSDYPTPTPNSLLEISKVDGLYVNGDGIIDGRGQVWWSTCKGNVCPRRPATAAFKNCNNLTLRGLTFVNSSGNHISITSCNYVLISRLTIQAPADSVNTDGIDITFSSFVAINKCYIATGDDCVAITNESHDINITKVHCGPGHGISIGSLGKGGGNDTIQNVHVWNCTFKDTQNGARIKTWQGGLGFARNIIYEDILFENAGNPIIIDQFYCPEHHCKNQTSAVKISDVAFRRVSGTSQSENAIVLHCSQTFGCSVQIEGANITSSKPGVQTLADCFNVQIQKGDLSNNVPSLENCH